MVRISFQQTVKGLISHADQTLHCLHVLYIWTKGLFLYVQPILYFDLWKCCQWKFNLPRQSTKYSDFSCVFLIWLTYNHHVSIVLCPNYHISFSRNSFFFSAYLFIVDLFIYWWAHDLFPQCSNCNKILHCVCVCLTSYQQQKSYEYGATA